MKITFGGFFRITPATIMRCGRTFRLARTHPAHARSSGLETSLRSRSLVGYTIDTHESEFSEATGRPACARSADRAREHLGDHVLSFRMRGLALSPFLPAPISPASRL